MDIEAKRLDSLARNRASAELKRRHPEEWEEIRAQIHNELQVERYVLGQVERDRNTPQHRDEDGSCFTCGESWPCRRARRREAEKGARVDTPTPKPVA